MTQTSVAEAQGICYSIIVPAYNEEAGLPIVVRQLQAALDETYEIIVVDDGSSDGTLEIAKGLGCRVISHPSNRGKGAAMRTGIRHASGGGVIFIDADGTYPVSAIPLIAAGLGEYDMIVGRRDLSRHNHPVNRFGNWLFGWLMRTLYQARITDPLSGLYGVRRDALQRMELQASGFEIESELTIKAANLHLKTSQIDIAYHERAGDTKLRPVQDGARILRTIFALLLLFRPTQVFAIPGFALFGACTALTLALFLGPIHIFGIHLGVHSLIFFSMLSLAGLQIGVLGIVVKSYAVMNGYSQADALLRAFTRARLATVLFLFGGLVTIVSLVGGLALALRWVGTGFSAINEVPRAVISSWALVLGLQSMFSALFLAVFSNELRRRRQTEQDEIVIA
jgi:hypothetical protein